jgi:hypothetical protein
VQYGFFDDKLGPVTLCVLIMLALTAIMVRPLLPVHLTDCEPCPMQLGTCMCERFVRIVFVWHPHNSRVHMTSCASSDPATMCHADHGHLGLRVSLNGAPDAVAGWLALRRLWRVDSRSGAEGQQLHSSNLQLSASCSV